MKYPRDHIVLHHTGAEEKDARQVREAHLRRGFRDVGYNYIIERNGLVVTGRSLDLPGAHCKAAEMNFKSVGVALIGNLENHPPTDSQQNSLVGLVKSIQQQHRIETGKILPHGAVPGASTLCPGRYFPYDLLLQRLGEQTSLWRVQVGAFSSRENAENYAKGLEKMGIKCYLMKPGDK